MNPRQWVLMIALVLCLSVAVGALPQQAQPGPPPRPSEAVKAEVARRPPVRTIHDADMCLLPLTSTPSGTNSSRATRIISASSSTTG